MCITLFILLRYKWCSYSIIKHMSEFHATLEEFRVKIDILSQQFDYIKLITYHLELTVSIFFASKINGK